MEICPAGTFSASGQSSCTNCGSANQYSSEGSDSCLTCPSGSYTNWETAGTTTATECNYCPAGYACDGVNMEICPAGTFSASGQSSCTNCGSANQYSSEGSDSCLTCPSGSYTNWETAGTTTATECNYCPAGYACDGVNMEICPAGTFSASGQSSCTNCGSANQYSSEGSDSCLTCPSGSYTNWETAGTTTATECNYCPAGYACDGVNMEICPAGTFSASGQSSCTNCGSANQYSSEGSDSCLTCPSGSYTNWETAGTTTATECNYCPAGYACDGVNMEICPAGTFSASGQSSCTNCGSANQYSSEGSDSCLTCPSGSYTNWETAGTTTATECNYCPAGYACDGVNMEICPAWYADYDGDGLGSSCYKESNYFPRSNDGINGDSIYNNQVIYQCSDPNDDDGFVTS